MSKCLNCGKETKNKKYCSISCQNKYKKIVNELNYNKEPKHCKQCGKPISYKNKENNFCCCSCSVKYNNKRRVVSEEQKEKTKESLKKYYTNISHVYKEASKSENAPRICKVCGKQYKICDNDGSTCSCCSTECKEYYCKKRDLFLKDSTREKLSAAGKRSVDLQGETRRSKNEAYFCSLCEDHFLNVKHNERVFNGWDADIIIEDLKIAVLWNGIWHYSQIGQNYPLKKVQNRDKIKIEEIKKCGYTPYIIKDLKNYNKDFVEKKFDELLEYIKKYCGVEQW